MGTVGGGGQSGEQGLFGGRDYSIAPRIPPSPNFELAVPNYGLFNRSAHSAEPELRTYSSQLWIVGPRGCPNISLHAPNNSVHGASRLELKNHENHIKS